MKFAITFANGRVREYSDDHTWHISENRILYVYKKGPSDGPVPTAPRLITVAIYKEWVFVEVIDNDQ